MLILEYFGTRIFYFDSDFGLFSSLGKKHAIRRVYAVFSVNYPRIVVP